MHSSQIDTYYKAVTADTALVGLLHEDTCKLTCTTTPAIGLRLFIPFCTRQDY